MAVDGVGSTWIAGADLFVGTDISFGSVTPTGPGSAGFVSVGNGGTLTATNVYIGASGTLTGSGGTINGDLNIIADFFGGSDAVFGAGFDASDIMVFTSVVGNVGQSIDVTFGGTT